MHVEADIKRGWVTTDFNVACRLMLTISNLPTTCSDLCTLLASVAQKAGKLLVSASTSTCTGASARASTSTAAPADHAAAAAGGIAVLLLQD